MNCLVNGSSTTSKRSIWPEETRGLWVVGAFASKLILSHDRNKAYDDWASALGANTLGYYEHKDATWTCPAASLPWQIEHDFAEEFCQAMGTEAVRFFKSGSDAVSCAVRLARGFTGRDHVIVFDKSYHGTGDWFGQALWSQEGIIPDDDHHLMIYPFGVELPFYKKFDQPKAHNIAAIVVEPAPKAIEEPPTGWLQHLREVCDEHGIILISDEIILGYRHTLTGYLRSQGVNADLYCYGKAMGQGGAISATTGNRAIMEQLKSTVHFSGTNNGEPLPLRISQETLKTYLDQDICAKLNAKGLRLKLMLNSSGFKTKGLNSRFEVVGWDMDATRFMFDQGILFPGFCSLAVSHNDSQMERLVNTLKEWRDK